jgi:hypothetical protein
MRYKNNFSANVHLWYHRAAEREKLKDGRHEMAKAPKNHGKDWTRSDVGQLRSLAKENTPTGLVAYKLGRTEDAVRSKASDENIALQPANQSPYNRRKK